MRTTTAGILIGLAVLALVGTVAASAIGASLLVAVSLTLAGLWGVTGVTMLRRRATTRAIRCTLCGKRMRGKTLPDRLQALDNHNVAACPILRNTVIDAGLAELEIWVAGQYPGREGEVRS